jgi:branched-chain amino acid transport system permease protein
MVMFAPGGIASLIAMNLRVAAFGRLRELWVNYLVLAVTSAIVLLGAAGMIEMTYHLKLNEALGPKLRYLSLSLDAKGFSSWLGCALVMLLGLVSFEVARRRFVKKWSAIQEFIATEIQRREAL